MFYCLIYGVYLHCLFVVVVVVVLICFCFGLVFGFVLFFCCLGFFFRSFRALAMNVLLLNLWCLSPPPVFFLFVWWGVFFSCFVFCWFFFFFCLFVCLFVCF